jgi:hypothetical protein
MWAAMAKSRLLFLDYETYYDRDYSLRMMSTPEYILDARFEVICCSVKEDMGPSHVVDGPDFGAFISTFDPAETTTVTFNSLFDNSILAWHYGFVPSKMLDSMGMARALLGHELVRFSLAHVGDYLNVGIKGDTLMKVLGMRRADIIANGLWPAFCDYANQDNEINAGIFFKLFPQFPLSERRVMNLVLRACVCPRFQVDTAMLTAHLKDVQDEKAALLASCGADLDQLMSSAKFQELLEANGVVVETKISPTGRTVPAFAKTDDFMARLQEHPDTIVQALACARLGHKSTLEETRTEKLLKIAQLPWSTYRDGKPRLYSGGTMPVPMRYGGAHTHRLSGEWGMNMQNLPSVMRSKGKSKLRLSLLAGPGNTIITADLGQIECRLSAWLCQCSKLIEEFAKYGAGDKTYDPYNRLGSAIFGFAVDRKVNLIEGFIGKTGILGLGYGCGVDHFFDMVGKLARAMGIDLAGRWDHDMAERAVKTYRTVYYPMKQGWNHLDMILKTSWLGLSDPVVWGPVVIGKGSVELPNGLFLNYDNPRVDTQGELKYTYGKLTHKIYGAKFLENITQALAALVIRNVKLRVSDRLRPLIGAASDFTLQAHDELVWIVPTIHLDECKKIIHEEMVRRQSWVRGLPLMADVKSGSSYGACS